jgi:hypothetical protein
VIALAGNLNFFAACGPAVVAAVFLALENRTGARLVRTDLFIFVGHISLLRKNARYRSEPFYAVLAP